MRILIENEADDALKAAYGEMLELSLKNPHRRQWYAAWFIESPEGEHIGELCFKGLNKEGGTEIGYGILILEEPSVMQYFPPPSLPEYT